MIDLCSPVKWGRAGKDMVIQLIGNLVSSFDKNIDEDNKMLSELGWMFQYVLIMEAGCENCRIGVNVSKP